MSASSPREHRLVVEAIEARILHAVDFAPALTADGGLAVEPRLHDRAAVETGTLATISFVDERSPHAHRLTGEDGNSRVARTLRIGAGEDGVARVTEALAGARGLNVVRLIPHAEDGVLFLGRSALDSAGLLAQADRIAAWGDAMAGDGRIAVQPPCSNALPADLAAGLGELTGTAIAGGSTLPTAAPASQVSAAALNFEINVGQANARYDFIARGSGYAIGFSGGNATLLLAGEGHGDAVELTLLGARADSHAGAEGAAISHSNYLVGTAEQWLTGIANYGAVRYDGLYDGIALRYYGNAQQLEYDFIVEAGADWRQIALRFEGARSAAIDADGALVLTLQSGATLRFHAPVAYQDGADGREPVASRYAIDADGTIRFELDGVDPSRRLVIDPVLDYGSYFGGTGADYGKALATDGSGAVYLAGYTTSPAAGNVLGLLGADDVFVVKFAGDLASRLYTTYVGGTGVDRALAIDVDGSGNAYVTGSTASIGSFPLTAPFNAPVVGTDAFVFKLNGSGDSLLYSRLLSAASNEEGTGIAVDAGGAAYVVGNTNSADLPVTAGAADAVPNGNEAWGFKLDGGGAIVFGTYVGGSGADEATGVAVDAAGRAVVVGRTQSSDFGTTANAFQSGRSGAEGFLAQLNAGGTAFLYKTYLGAGGADEIDAVAVDGAGIVYVAGATNSNGFPVTAGAAQTSAGSSAPDAFVSVFDPDLSGAASLLYSTYIGGNGADDATGIAVDGSGMIYVTGTTTSTDLPVTGDALQSSPGGAQDAFVVKLNRAGAGSADRIYASYLGGPGTDAGNAAAFSGGRLYIAGDTTSGSGIAVAGGNDTAYGGGTDAFVVGYSFSSAPVITSNGGGASASISVAENSTAVTTVTATDPDSAGLVYSIAGGADAARFTIDAATGAFRFAAAPSYEAPTDAGGNNVYQVNVRASDGTHEDTQALSVTVTDVLGAPGAATGTLWFTTAGNQISPAGGATWNAGQVLQYGNLGDRFDIDGNATTGSVDVLAGFNAPVPLRGMHYVSSAITIGSGAASFALNPGDLLLVLDPGGAATVTLNAGDGNASNDIVVDRKDIVVFRPTVAGNYASGEYFMLLDNGVKNGGTGYNVHALALVEADTTVGGVLLPAGTFVVAHSTPAIHNNVYTFTVTGTGVGAATATSNTSLLLDGDALGLPANGDQIQGLHVMTGPTAFNDTVLPTGTVLVAIKGSHTFAGVAQDAFDIVALAVTRTERNGGTLASGQMLFDGSDLGINAFNINGLTVVTGAASNSVPTVAVPLADRLVFEDAPFSFTIPAGSFTDADTGDTLTYSATLAGGGALPAWLAFNAATRTFNCTPGSADIGTVTVRVTAVDPQGASAADEFVLTVANVNDAPRGSDATVVTSEDQAYVFSIADFGLSDPLDSPANTLAAVRIGSLPAAGTLRLDGAAVAVGQQISAADITVGKLRFTPAADGNGSAYASFGFQVRDNGGTANGGVDLDPVVRTITVDVTSVNDAPVITSNGGGGSAALSISENSTAVTTVAAGDVDGDAVIYSISGGADAARFTINAGTGELVFATAPDYESPADADGNNVYQVTVRASDGTDDDTQAISVTVTDVNETLPNNPPVLVLPIADQAALEDSVFGFTLPVGTFTDADAGDTLSYSASSAGGGALPAWLAFDAATRTFSGTPAGADVGAVTVRVIATDPSGAFAFDDFTLAVGNINDAPRGADTTVRASEDQTYVFAVADFGFADPLDSPPDSLAAVRISTLPAAGTLTIDGAAVAAGLQISAADITVGKLRFTPAADGNGSAYAGFGFQVRDDGGTAGGGADLDPTVRTMSIDVTAVNDPPAGASRTVSTFEDRGYVFSAADFGFIDPIDGNALAAVRIDTPPLAGTLKRGGSTVSAGMEVSAPDLASGKLVFIPAANASGGSYASFTFRVRDNGGTAGGGVDLDPTVRTMTIDVAAANDAPSGTDRTVGTREDTAYVFAAADFGFSDPFDVPADALAAVRIGSLPDAGALTLNGAPVAVGAEVSAADLAAGRLLFTPAPDASGNNYASFDFQVRDAGGTANGGADLDASANRLRIEVTAVNDSPALAAGTVPRYGPAAANPPGERISEIFKDAFSDPDRGARFSGVAVVGNAADPIGQGRWQYSTGGDRWADIGSVSDGANALALRTDAKLRFLPATGSTGAPPLLVRALDDTYSGAFSTTGATETRVLLDTAVAGGSSAIAGDRTPITVGGNAAPTGADGHVNVLEDGVYTFRVADFGFSDPDNGDVLAAVRIVSLPSHGRLALDGAALAAATEVRAADLAAGRLTFTPDRNGNGTGYAAFRFQVRDDGGTAGGGVDLDPIARTITIDVTPVNDAPSGADTTIAAVESTPYAFTSRDFGFSDPADANALAGVRITRIPALGTLTLNGIAASIGTEASAADLAAARLVYTPAPHDNGRGYASLSFELRDDGGTANGGADLDPTANTVTIDVAAVNDPPSGADRIVVAREDTPYALREANFGFSDADGHALAAVRVVAAPIRGTLTLGGSLVGAGTEVAAADIAAGRLVFLPDADGNGTGYAALSFQVRDRSGDPDPTANTLRFDVVGVNDAPHGTSGTVRGAEDAAYAFTAADFGFTDAADGNALAAVRIGSLPAAGQLTNDGVAVSVAQEIGAADIAAGLLRFTPAANANGNAYASFGFQVRDNGGTAGAGVDLDPVLRSLSIDVAPVNDPPAGADRTVSTFEDSAYVFTAADFGFTDPTDGNALAAVRIGALPSAGSLSLNGAAVANGQQIAAADIAAGRLRFTPAANANGNAYASFVFQVRDDGGTAGGGVDLDPTVRTVRIDVLPVNDRPAGTDRTVTTAEDVAYVFGTADFGFTDAADGNALAAVRIGSLPAAGRLTLDGVAVASGQQIAAADIAGGRLRFTPAADANGSGYASLGFQVRDDGGRADGGVDLDATVRTMSIDVTAVDDAPSIVGNTLLIAQGQSAAPEIVVDDIDTAPAALSIRVVAVSGGHFALAGGNAAAVSSFSYDDVLQGRIRFVDDGDAIAPGFTIEVSSGSAAPASATATIAFTPAPVLPPAPAVAAQQSAETRPVEETRADKPNSEKPAQPAIDAPQTIARPSVLELGQVTLPGLGAVSVSVTVSDRPNIEAPRSAVSGSTRDAVLAAFVQADLAQLTVSQAQQTFTHDELLRQFEQMQHQLRFDGAERDAFVASAAGVASGLTVGYVFWLVRGGVLLSAMLSTLPAWQLIDPLPVMTSTTAVRRRSNDKGEAVERLFDRHAAANSQATRNATAPAGTAAQRTKPTESRQ